MMYIVIRKDKEKIYSPKFRVCYAEILKNVYEAMMWN